MKKTLKSIIALTLFICLITASSSVSYAAANPSVSKLNDISAFIDGFANGKIKSGEVPGMAVAVVKDGKIIFKKGYGFANIKTKMPVDPDNTVFCIGSAGKLFTGTAIMQLYEKGLINLNDDISRYTKGIKIKNPYSKPITFSNLLTHTSGLDEEDPIGGSVKDPSKLMTYRDFINFKKPIVNREPGLSTRYSNMGYDLLGYLIQEVSAKSYEDYITENILSPLNMKNTYIARPSDNLATGYNPEGKGFVPTENYIYSPSLGAGSINSTVTDIASFMIAHLDNGKFDEKRILNEETSKLMHRQHFTNDPKLPGMAYTFIQDYRNGQYIIKHEGGDISGYTSSLFLIPDCNFGFFIVTNSLSHVPFEFEEKLLNEFFPVNPETIKPMKNSRINMDEFEGMYSSHDGITQSTIVKMTGLFSDDGNITIQSNNDGSLIMKGSTLVGEKPGSVRLIQVEPMVFQREDNRSFVVFKQNEKGHITGMFNDNAEVSFEKSEWYETQNFNFALFTWCMLVFIVSLFILFANCIKRIRKHNPAITKTERFSRFTSAIVCVLNITCSLGIIIYFISAGYDFVYGVSLIFYIMLTGLIISSALSVILIIFNILVWRRKSGTKFFKIHYTLITASSVAFIWFLNQWNILGFNI